VLTTTLAALTAVAAPLALVTALAGGPDPASASQPTSEAALGNLDEVRARNADEATLASIASLAQAVAPPTSAAPTTTAPPPPTTTTQAPAPPPPAPAPAVQPVVSGGGYNDPNNPAAWDRLAACESGGNWAANTGNGYYGGIQFSLSSWQAVGGTGRPDQASRETQIAMGQRLWNQGGWSHWPACSSQLGYR
jgi:hypothetical protein